MDHHRLATISLSGSLLDVTGALYLAYDILGGRNGPLRALTRAVTYGLLYGTGYGLVFGIPFGIAAGIAHGITFAFELTRASSGDPPYPLSTEVLFSAIRGAGYAVGVSYTHGWAFAAYFGLLSTAGQSVAYWRGIRPALDYRSDRAPGITHSQLIAVVVRSIGYLAAGYVSAGLAGHHMHALSFGLEVGLSVGVLTAAGSFVTPYIEWTANNMPEKRMGVLGVVLILIGFTLQSIQYWLSLFDVPVN